MKRRREENNLNLLTVVYVEPNNELVFTVGMGKNKTLELKQR